MRFVYKCCISLTKLAFHLQTVHLNLQTCVSLTIVAPRFTNATFRFTIKLPAFYADGRKGIGFKPIPFLLNKCFYKL